MEKNMYRKAGTIEQWNAGKRLDTIQILQILILILVIFLNSFSVKAAEKHIALNKTALSLGKGDTCRLRLKNADGAVKWTSSNKKIAVVASDGKVTGCSNGTCMVNAKYKGTKYTCKVTVGVYKIAVPDQAKGKWLRGCEGCALYMALKGKGYIEDLSFDSFMETMPLTSSNPEKGFAGNPLQMPDSSDNKGKRTTINPVPLAKWGAKYGKVKSMEGCSISDLKKELRKGNPVVVYVTGGWAKPRWRNWPWGKAVVNNHALCLVGYNANNGKYLVHDTDGKKAFWVSRRKFESVWLARRYAVVVR